MRLIGLLLLVTAIGSGHVLAGSDASSEPSQQFVGEVNWPEQWTVFLPLHRDDAVAEDQLSTVPDALTVDNRTVAPQTVTPDDEGVFDFVPLFGGLAPDNTAYVFLKIESGSAQQVTLGMGADWWMQAWVNGKEVVNTTNEGNEHWPPAITDHVVHAPLREGTNVLAIKFISGSGSSRLAVGGPQHLRDASRVRYSEAGSSVHGLDAFMERHGVKPYDLFFENDGLRTHRLIFEDVEYGTPIWMVDDAPLSEHTTTSSVWSAWNANASRLFIPGHRPTKDGSVMRGGLVNADFTRIHPRLDDSRHPIWAPDDPDIYYLTFGGTQLREINEAKRTRRTVAEWDSSFTRSRIYGLTKDGRYVFLDTPNGGIWMPYEPGNVPIPDTGLNPGRPAKPQADGSPSHPLDNHEFWRPHTSVSTDHEQWGPIVRVRVGMLIDRETGEIDHVIAPLEGNEAYLRLFMGQNGRILFPEGERWEKYRIHRADTVDEMQKIYNYYPTSTHGHQDASPDGRFVVRDGMAARFWRMHAGAPFGEVKVSSDGEYYHMHWSIHPRFFVGWIRGWQFRTFEQTNNGNIVYQGFSDGTWQPLFNTHHRFNGYYAGGDFSMQSPDATKIHTASNMTGRFRNYVAVMARPRPPEQVQWQADGEAVELTWEPSAYSNETRGYLVYRSTRSGDEYVLQTHEPVEQTTWRDEHVDSGQDYYYVITALEHSGLESGFSMEVARAGVNLPADIEDRPLVIYVEPEHAVRDLYTDDQPGLAMGRDVREASDWYYLYRHPNRSVGAASMSIEVPAAGDYHLWARVRSNRPDNVWTRVRGLASEDVVWRIKLDDAAGEARTNQDSWTWVRAGESAVALAAGEVDISFETGDEGAEIDLLALSTDAGFEPEGRRPEMQTPPQPVQNLEARNQRERVNELHWSASDDPSFAHYHVYASRIPFKQLSQQHRIGSPTEARFTDWGLRAGATYHYAVTTVDRWGNESKPTFAEASTPSREHEPVHLELAFADAQRQGLFEESTAGGLRGSAYLVPKQPRSNHVTWRVSIPREGEYFLWLRYLHRGSGMRGNETDNNVHVLLDDEHLVTVGGRTDLNVPDRLIDPDHPMAEQFWTWAVPGDTNLEAVRLPAGEHTLTLDNLNGEIRYDVLLITDEPAYRPDDGRLRQR